MSGCARLKFQSTPPHEGRLFGNGSTSGSLCFNPRPRTRGDLGRPRGAKGKDVSIHAPARGATLATHPPVGEYMVSIHAPARGATMIICKERGQTRCFNPRPRTRGDPGQSAPPLAIYRVSIHAPARGATFKSMAAALRSRVSIHAPARGATSLARPLPKSLAVSIHAPARGATPTQWPTKSSL